MIMERRCGQAAFALTYFTEAAKNAELFWAEKNGSSPHQDSLVWAHTAMCGGGRGCISQGIKPGWLSHLLFPSAQLAPHLFPQKPALLRHSHWHHAAELQDAGWASGVATRIRGGDEVVSLAAFMQIDGQKGAS